MRLLLKHMLLAAFVIGASVGLSNLRSASADPGMCWRSGEVTWDDNTTMPVRNICRQTLRVQLYDVTGHSRPGPCFYIEGYGTRLGYIYGFVRYPQVQNCHA